jgi:hypothetical protein
MDNENHKTVNKKGTAETEVGDTQVEMEISLSTVAS